MAEAVATAATAGVIKNLADDIVEPVIDTLYGETVRGFTRVFKLWVGDRFFKLRDLLVQSFARLEDARPKPDFGFSPEGIMDVFMAFIYASTWLSTAIGDELAEELFSEMIQEGVSNAIQTSYGGTLQTIFNVYRGGTPINPDDIRDAYNIKDLLDNRIHALNIASSGNNLYAILHYLIAGGYEQIQRNYMTVINQVQQLGLRVLENALYLDEYLLTLIRSRIQERIHTAMETYDYLISLMTANAESVLARFNDYRTSIKSILEETYAESPTATEEQCFATVEADAKSAQTTYNNFREVYQRIENEMNNVTLDIPDDEINAYVDAVRNYAQKVAQIFDAVNTKFIDDLNDLITFANTIKDMILAYRQKYTTASVWGISIQEIAEPEYICKQLTKVYTLEVIVYGEE